MSIAIIDYGSGNLRSVQKALEEVGGIDPLILNLPDELYKSPLRTDPRPMIGVFHATYVSAKIAQVFLNIYNAIDDRELLHPLAENLDEAIRGILEIEKHAKLTENGQLLVDNINEFIELAKSLPDWKKYDFKTQRIHRFGVGVSKVNELQRLIA